MRNPDAWRSLRSPFLTGLALSLAVVLLSLAALGEGTAAKPDLPTLPAVPTPAPAPTPSAPAQGERDRAQTLRVLQKDGTVESMTMADYLWRVAAAEMPALPRSRATLLAPCLVRVNTRAFFTRLRSIRWASRLVLFPLSTR